MCNIKTRRKQENGIQVIKEHRDIVQADSPVQHGVPRLVCRGDGVERVEFLPFCGEAAGENLCAGQREVADAGPLAGSVAEPSGGGEGACAPLPRAVLHALAGEECDRAQREAGAAAG